MATDVCETTDSGRFRLTPDPTATGPDCSTGFWRDVEFDEDGGCNVVLSEIRCPHCETTDTATALAGVRWVLHRVECVDCSGWDPEEFGPYLPGRAEIGGDL